MIDFTADSIDSEPRAISEFVERSASTLNSFAVAVGGSICRITACTSAMLA